MTRFFALLAALGLGCHLLAADVQTIELEDAKDIGSQGARFRDKSASGGVCAGLWLSGRMSDAINMDPTLPRGVYELTFYLWPRPLATNHGLLAQLQAGSSVRLIQQGQFNAEPGFQPYRLRVDHPGGPLQIRIRAAGSSGYDGMRQATTEEEKAATSAANITNSLTDISLDNTKGVDAGLDDDLGGLRLEAERELTSLLPNQLVLAADRVTIETLATPTALVLRPAVDKIHYKPGETVTLTATLDGAPGDYTLLVQDLTELSTAHEVSRQAVTIDKSGTQAVELAYTLAADAPEFGHELRLTLLQGDTPIHSAGALFGCSRNVYRMGITGGHGGQDKRELTAEKAAEIMRQNKANYANYFEVFAWGPCDYSELTPDTEIFYSGQVQYPGSVTGFKNLLAQAHRYGVKGITYGKASAAGIDGANDWRRYPEYYRHGLTGPSTEAYNTFYLERMLDGAYLLHAKPIDGGWQHWASFWTNMGPGATDHGADEIIATAEMFGWDGVRWDGHFHDQMARFKTKVNAELPDFVHGYNIAFANPGQGPFLPPADLVEDFHECARDHGLMMDESVRNWSHTNFSPGWTQPFYVALAQEADYIKRIGGLPLYITFDMASPQDTLHCVLHGLAAGQRYTYITSPHGGFAYGSLPKFLTRYAAYVWDDTARIADPAGVLSVTVPDAPEQPAAKHPAPWWQETVWLRALPDGRQQLLVNLLNPANYPRFNDRVQTPARELQDLTLSLKLPAGARLSRAFHVSPDLLTGHELLDADIAGDQATVTLPSLGLWSIVGFELEGAPTPAYTLTDPVGVAQKILTAQAAKAEAKAADQRADASIAPRRPDPALDFENERNVDEPVKAKTTIPDDLYIRRDGVMDLHHLRGLFAWLNPVESAMALSGGGRYTASWVDRVGFKLKHAGAKGQLDDFLPNWRSIYDQDVIVVDNINRVEIGSTNRVRLEQYVSDGGGLLIFGGYMNLSMGADRNSYMETLAPVSIRAFKDMAISTDGMTLQPEPGSILADLDWSAPPIALQVDQAPLKDGAQVLARVGEHPAIVAMPYGQGRVIAVLMNPMGDYPEGQTPYWEWPEYPALIARLLDYLAPAAGQTIPAPTITRKLNPKAVQPDHFMLEAYDMSDAEFTKALASARTNMIDTESARMVLQAALQYRDKCTDIELLRQVAETAGPYLDASFAPLAIKLTKDTLSYNRAAGYRVLGLSEDHSHTDTLIAALRDEDEPHVRREILLAIGRLGDAEAAPAVRRFLQQKPGTDRLLALTVLHQMGEADAFAKALPVYEAMTETRLKLKSGRRSLHEDLYGGVSFKLTPTQRRQLQADMKRLRQLEDAVIDDLFRFRQAIGQLSDEQLATLASYVAASENRHLTPLAFQVFAPLDDQRMAPLQPTLADAKQANIRLLVR